MNPLLSRETFPQSLDADIDDRIEERPDLTPAVRPEERTVRRFHAETEENGNGPGKPGSRDDVVERFDTELMRIHKELRVAKAQINELSRGPFSRSSSADTTSTDAGQVRGTDVRIGQIDVIVVGRPERKAVVPPRDAGYASRAYLRRL